MVIKTVMANSRPVAPVKSVKENGGRNIRNKMSVTRKIKGKLAPAYIWKVTRRVRKMTLSMVEELA